MAKKKKNKTKSSWFGSAPRKRVTKTQRKHKAEALRLTVIIFIVLAVLAAAGIGLVFLERYVNSDSPTMGSTGRLEFIGQPQWVNSRLRDEIVAAAAPSSEDLVLDESTARNIAENLLKVAWLDDIKVRVTDKAIRIGARYRRPLALIKVSGKKYYLDNEFVLLDYVPISELAIVEIKGFRSGYVSRAAVGFLYQQDDIAAAVTLLELLSRMDAEMAADKPLLDEIASIDVSNYNGRKSSSKPHIILYAKDGTEIFWGAEKGKWHLNLEAKDEEKLTLLYNTYETNGTLQLRSNHKGSFIDLTMPRKSLSMPIDRY